MNRWENIGGKYLLNALGANPLAASQSVAMYLDPVAKCIEWHTNGHVIRLRPDLPSAIVSGPFATSFGYEWNLAGGLVFGVGDVSLTKRAGKLDTWGLEGVQVYYIVPVGQIPNTPTINIEKIDILDGMIEQLDLRPQGVLSAEEIAEGFTRDGPWVNNSLAIAWQNKRCNNSADNHGNYMSGKVLHKAAPLAHPLVCADLQAGNSANRSFGAANGSETTGWWDVLPGGMQKAFNRQDLEDNRGIGTHYAFAATLGYTTIGASNGSTGFGTFGWGWWHYPATEDGTVDSLVVGTNIAGVFAGAHAGVYQGTATPADALVTNGDSGNIASTHIGSNLQQFDFSGTKPLIVSGNDYVPVVRPVTDHSAAVLKYDASSPQNYRISTTLAAPLPATYGSPAATRANRESTAYFIYTPAGGGGGIIPQIMHHRRMMRQ